MRTKSTARGLVSVIIPTCRRPEAVREAARSVLEQTWQELEVIVVSDGPDPETREALSGLDARLQLIELPQHGGPAAARNAGVARSKGEWIAFLDDDDEWLPGKIKAQMAVADPSRPHRMVSCRTIYRRGDREDLWPQRPLRRGEDVADYILRRPSLLGRPGVVNIQSLLIHRSILEQIPFTHHKDHEDWAWLLQAWHQADARVVFVWEPFVIYNIDTEGISRSRRVNWQDSLDWAQQHRRWIGDRAFCSFLSTKAALKAKRAGDWQGFKLVAGEVLRSRPAPMDLVFLSGVSLLPGSLLQSAWRRSLRDGGQTQSSAGSHLA